MYTQKASFLVTDTHTHIHTPPPTNDNKLKAIMTTCETVSDM